MSTRIYLPYGSAPTLSPALTSAWERTSSYRYANGVTKQGTVFGEVSNYEYNVAAQYDAIVAQFVSGPLQAQTISGTVKGQILARQSSAAADLCLAMVIKVVTAVGITRGVLLSYFPETITTELSDGAPVNRSCPPADTALTELEIANGDRLVIEIGFRAFNTSTDYMYGYLTFGDGAASDLPEDETETEYLNPWVEFSGDLVWQLESAYAPSGYLKLCGYCTLSDEEIDLISNYAADGCLDFVGGGVLDAPTTTAFVAGGALQICGQAAYDSPPRTAFRAAGQLELCGASRMASTAPYIDPAISLITRYAAEGSFYLFGTCPMESVLRRTDAYVAAGGYVIGGGCGLTSVSPARLRVDAYAAAGCYELSGPCINPRGPVSAYAANTETGPCLRLTSRVTVGFLYPQVTEMVAAGCYILESPEFPDEGVFETLVLTWGRSEISVYSNFKFNSYAKYGGKYYGATQDGIFLLEGDDDAGAPIHSGAQIGPVNFGTDREKRLRLIRCGGDCDQALVRVSDGNGKSGQFPVRAGRADISRAVQGRELTVEIVDFKSLNHLEIIPLVLAKR